MRFTLKLSNPLWFVKRLIFLLSKLLFCLFCIINEKTFPFSLAHNFTCPLYNTNNHQEFKAWYVDSSMCRSFSDELAVSIQFCWLLFCSDEKTFRFQLFFFSVSDVENEKTRRARNSNIYNINSNWYHGISCNRINNKNVCLNEKSV